MPTLDLGSVVGPPGPQGEIGPQGAVGIQGDPGAAATINGVNALTLTAGDNITLKQEGSNLEIGAEVPGKILNLNWDFRKPVNRNGKTEYTDYGHVIDMWIMNPYCNILITSNGLKITHTSSEHVGILETPYKLSYLSGKTVTISCLFEDGYLLSNTIVIPASIPEGTSFDGPDFDYQNFIIDMAASVNDVYRDEIYFRLANNSGIPRTVIAAVLEEGDHQTHFRQNADGQWEIIDPIDYDTQYLLCSQYSPITGEWVGSQHSNKNLLDNWYFVGGGSQLGGGKFPINQQGQTEYAAKKYTIDRWANIVDGMTTSLTEDVLHLTSRNNFNFAQPCMSIEEAKKRYKGLTLTLSFLLSTGLTSVSYTFTGSETYLDVAGNNVSNAVANMWFNVEQSLFICDLYAQSPSDIYLIAAKLELGPVQTLAHKEGDTWVLNDPPPDYALELVKCQRYQLVIGNRMVSPFGTFVCRASNCASSFIPLPTMRAMPTVTFIGNFRAITSDKIASGSNLTGAISGWSATGIEIAIDGFNGLSVGDTGWLDTEDGNAIVIFDANL